MINKTRLELFEVLSELSEQFPEVRLGQLISNLATLAKGPQVEAIWDAEDKELLEAAKKKLETLHIETLPKVRVVRAGDGFLFAACKLFENRSEGTEWSSPLIVNLALAIELYLKSYTAEDDKVPYLSTTVCQVFVKPAQVKNKDHHKLERLYQKIDDVIKEELDRRFSNSNLSEKFDNLDTALSAFSNAFVEARYSYEKKLFKESMCISDLYSIANFLKEAIYEIGEFVKDNKTNTCWKRN